MCGSIQLLVDFIIVGQIYMYKDKKYTNFIKVKGDGKDDKNWWKKSKSRIHKKSIGLNFYDFFLIYFKYMKIFYNSWSWLNELY